MRELIAAVVLSDPDTYTEAFLGKPPQEYMHWIMNSEKWGGEIELSILSKQVEKEIAVIDIQTSNVYVYGEGQVCELFAAPCVPCMFTVFHSGV
jgi:ubiquitin thioesterase OTU1